MFLSKYYKPKPLPSKFAKRDFPPEATACPTLRSIPGVISGTSAIWELASDLATPLTVAKGEVIYPDMNSIPPFIYLKNGRLCVNCINEDGDEFLLHLILPGATVWDGFYCSAGQIEPMPLKALAESTILLFDSRLTFDNLMEINPLLVRNLMYSQSLKNLEYSKLALINSYRSPLARVALLIHEMYLVWHVKKFPSLISQVEMALLLQLHKVTVSKIISRLKAEGAIVNFSRSKVEITAPDLLVELALSASQKD